MFTNYPDVVTVNQLKTMLNIGRDMAYALIQQNIIPSMRIGRKYIISKQDVEIFVKNNTARQILCYNNLHTNSGLLTKNKEV